MGSSCFANDPVFQWVSPLGRGILKKKKNRGTIHFNGEYCNVDLLCRTVHSANQLCIYGAVTKWPGNKPGTHSREASQSRLESARKTSPEIQIKQEELKSLVDIPMLEGSTFVLTLFESCEPCPAGFEDSKHTSLRLSSCARNEELLFTMSEL